MLALTSLVIGQFRSHAATRLALDGRPVAIYGANGSGKTNLLEAVSLFSPGRGMRRASAEDMARRAHGTGWKLSGILSTGGSQHEVETWSEAGAARQVRIGGKAASQIDLGRIARIVWLVPAMDRLWLKGAEGRRRFLDRMVLSFQPCHAERSLTYEKARQERNRLLKNQVRDAAWYDALETQMAEAGHVIHIARQQTLETLRRAQTEAETAFPVAELDLIQTEGAMPDSAADLRSALAESRVRDMAAGRTLVGPHRADMYCVYTAKSVPAKECSTGEQKALLISLILANARALARDSGLSPIMLLDEVAAHLDAQHRAALYEDICALGAQAWMTGTGPELFDDLQDRAQRFEVREQSDDSQVEEKS
ncbi:MAG: DNA replication/repair protein RecF [Rhodobacteraceae bacterium]|nr:DNA replication/repair protein RecF [Paracoccaceae bacterium]